MAGCKHPLSCSGKCEHLVDLTGEPVPSLVTGEPEHPVVIRGPESPVIIEEPKPSVFTSERDTQLHHQLSGLLEQRHALKEQLAQYRYGQPHRQRVNLLGMVLDACFRWTTMQLRITECRDIGSGAEGQVFAAIAMDLSGNTDPISVAIKVIAIDTAAQREAIARQTTLWKGIDNLHVLPLLGTANLRADGTLVGLITPLMAGGTLDSLPEVPDQQPLEIRRRLLTIRQVAQGIEYMHREARIVHGDIKGGNVLISEAGDAVIADFGLSTSIAKQANPTVTDIRGAHTLRFAAPELLEDAAYDDVSPAPPRSKTTYSDIYAFGSLIYETWTGSAPWSDMDDRDVIITVNSGCIPPRRRPGIDHAPFSDELWELCLRCWNRDVRRRPTAGEVVRALDDIVRGL